MSAVPSSTKRAIGSCGSPFRFVKASHWKLLVVCAVVTLSTVVLVVFSSSYSPPEKAFQHSVYVVEWSPINNQIEGTELMATHDTHPSPPNSHPPDAEQSPSMKSDGLQLPSNYSPPDVEQLSMTPDNTTSPSNNRLPDVDDSNTTPDSPLSLSDSHYTDAEQSSKSITSVAVTTHPPPSTKGRKDIWASPQRRPCPKGGIVTVQEAGRLGNQMWQYATTWATARKTGLEPFIPRSLRRDLDKVFRDLSIPSVDVIAHCRLSWWNKVTSPYERRRPNQNIVLPVYPFYETYVVDLVDDLRREFTFQDELLRQSQERLRGIRKPGNVTYVGVHVRRTDYGHHLWVRGKASLADEHFFYHAMAYFREKYGGNVAFIVSSDDRRWCQRKLAAGRSDVFVLGGKGISSPEQDLALMASCNHSIIDYGTFGCWGAIFANGETVVYNLSVPVETSMIIVKRLPNWRVMD